MLYNNIAQISAAGSGKTTEIVENVISCTVKEKILIVTYTIENTFQIINKIRSRKGLLPSNIEVLTWHSFLLQHCIRPFRSSMWNIRIDRIDFKSRPIYGVPESNIRSYYFSSYDSIYKDRAAKFAIKCNEKSNYGVIRRLELLYNKIFIDEVQDMAGDDLDYIKIILKSKIKLYLVGDIRQALYFTNYARKNKGKRGCNLLTLFKEWENENLLQIKYKYYSYRCNQAICNLSDSIFPNIEKKTISKNNIERKHSGLFIIKTIDYDNYIKEIKPVILRWDKRAQIPLCEYNPLVYNIGISKGLTFNDVLVVCTEPFRKFISKGIIPNSDKSKCSLYVAVTRARFSVAFLHDEDFDDRIYSLYIPKDNR